jgi:hypothetical protein
MRATSIQNGPTGIIGPFGVRLGQRCFGQLPDARLSFLIRREIPERDLDAPTLVDDEVLSSIRIVHASKPTDFLTSTARFSRRARQDSLH